MKKNKGIASFKGTELEIQQKVEDLALINSLNNSINQGKNLQDIIKEFCREIKKNFSGNGVSLYLLSENKKSITIQNNSLSSKIERTIEKVAGKKINELRTSLKPGSVYWKILQSGKTQIMNDPAIIKKIMTEFTENKTLQKLVPAVFKIMGYKSLMVVPLISGSNTVGLFDIGRRQSFTESERERFENLAKQLTSLILQKNSTEALQKSEEKYRQLIENLHEGVCVIDKETKITFVNPRTEELFKYKADEMIGKPLYSYMDKHSSEFFKLYLERSKEGIKEQHKFKFHRKDGTTLYTRLGLSPIKDKDGNYIGAITTVMDITDLKREEDERVLLFKIVENVSTTTNLDELLHSIYKNIKKIIYAKNCYIALFDPITEIVSFPLFIDQYDTAPLPRKKIKGLTEYVLKTGEPSLFTKKIIQNLIKKKEIEKIGTPPESWLGVPLYIQSFPLGVLAVQSYTKGQRYSNRDKYLLTAIGQQAAFAIERKKAEEAIKKSETRHRMLFEQSMDGIMLADQTGILKVNQAFCKIQKMSPMELIGKNPIDLIYPDDRNIAEARIKTLLQEKTLSGESNYRALRADGSVIWVEVRSKSFKWEGKTVFQSIVRDITDRKRAEEEIHKTEKLESLSILAGGIAHDFNNLLTGILGNISLAKIKINQGDTIFKILMEAEKAATRAKGLTQQLLTFAKGGSPIKKIISIADSVQDSANFALRGSRVKCKFSVPDKLWQIEADEDQMNQVINNLIINADMAMPEGGVINVGIENIIIKKKHTLPLAEGKYLKITIKDQGIGIKKEHLQKIFDPYFTTKQKGSGLGLATAYSIIMKHRGYIEVESELGTGTSFHIYLPASSKKITKKKILDKSNFLSKAKVLVMDDEQIVKDVLNNMLNYIGCKTVFSSNGQEAISFFEQAKNSEKPFDVVIMDLTIPGGMGGKETIKALLQIDPNIKAIVSSGYSNDPIISNFKEHGFSGFVTKPYRIEELSEILQNVIEEKED